jgi:acid phosphatase family membrane protein YuiD
MFIRDFFGNHILLSVVLSYLLAGVLKIFFYYLGTNKIEPRFFFRTGGMPSSHTASVTAMTVSIYLLEGVSNLFIVCFIMSMVVISDAVGVRRAAGKQARLLNTMIDELLNKGNIKAEKLYVLLGHTPKQVLGGLILGTSVALFVSTL